MSISVNDLVMLSDTCGKSVCGTIFGSHMDAPTVLYIPSWMTLQLDALEVKIAHIPKRHCTALRIKPHTSDFKTNPEFVRLLNAGIKAHRSITNGTKIPLLINGSIEYLTIEEMLPSDAPTCFIYGREELDVQIAKPLENEERSLSSFLYKAAPGREIFPFAFMGRGRISGGLLFTKDSPQKAAADAARKRLALHAAGKRSM